MKRGYRPTTEQMHAASNNNSYQGIFAVNPLTHAYHEINRCQLDESNWQCHNLVIAKLL